MAERPWGLAGFIEWFWRPDRIVRFWSSSFLQHRVRLHYGGEDACLDLKAILRFLAVRPGVTVRCAQVLEQVGGFLRGER